MKIYEVTVKAKEGTSLVLTRINVKAANIKQAIDKAEREAKKHGSYRISDVKELLTDYIE